jgi:uncharacterized protein GlcG (DUF336 family)
MTDITLAQARSVVDAALLKSRELGTAMNVAVVDSGANLTAFDREDGAWRGSIDIAIRKARTARYFDMETADLGTLTAPGQPLYGIEVTNGGLVSFPGGVLLRVDGEIVGAVGVSGSTVDDDRAVALAGAAALD